MVRAWGGDWVQVPRRCARFLEQQQAFPAELLTDIGSEPRFALHATPEVIARNRRLIAVGDAMSLPVCSGRRDERGIGGVPTVVGETVLASAPERATRLGSRSHRGHLPTMVTLRFEGQRLPRRFTDEAAMPAALAHVPWASFEGRLHPTTESAVR